MNFKSILRKVLRQVLKVFWIFPLERNKIVFSSFNGTCYGCNPKYLTEYFLENCPDQVTLVWILNDDHKPPRRVRVCKRHSILSFFELTTAGYIVDNLGFPSFLPKRKGQIMINTWHAGGAYKRCTQDAIGYDAAEWDSMRYRGERTDYVLSSCAKFTEQIPTMLPGFCGEVLECGLPRNDVFFNRDWMGKLRKKAYETVGEKQEKVVLYAPTFRGDVRHPNLCGIGLPAKQLKEALQERFGGHFSIWVHLHPSQRDCISNMPGVMDVSMYDDMQELLCAADVLISDYSSLIWDFALTGKPCFLLVPDLDNYMNEERGFYVPIDEWPGILAENEQRLLQQILHFDEQKFAKQCADHLEKMGSFESGKACTFVAERCFQEIRFLK